MKKVSGRTLNISIRRRILTSLQRLAADPYASPNVKALAGEERNYRLRVGDWRVIYTLHDAIVVVVVLRIAHRRDAYR